MNVPSSCMGPEGVGGREGKAKVKARPTGLKPLRGGWGRGGVPTPSRTHPRLGVQRGLGRPRERWGVGAWRNGRERGQCFPCPLRHQRACWAPGPNSLPSVPPSCCTETKPHPYTPTQGPTSTLREPLQWAGPKLHPHTLTHGLASKPQNSTL